MDNHKELRMRCIEAAVKAVMVHEKGAKDGIQEVAETWFKWVVGEYKDKGICLPAMKAPDLSELM